MLVYVMIDNPRLGHFGGKVAAPTFKKIVQRVLRFIDIVPESNVYFADKKQKAGRNKQTRIPDLTNRRVDAAKEIANQFGLELIVENKGDLISSQKLVLNKTPAQLFVKLKKFGTKRGAYTFVPSVKGLGLRDALAKMSQERLRVIVHGSGRVVRQSPKPGEKIHIGKRCVVECEPAINLAQYKSW